MTTLAFVLAGATALLTLFIFSFSQTPGPRHGPDAAGLEMFYLLVCPVRWAVLAVLLGVSVRAGGLAWLSRHAEAQWAAIFAVHAVAGGLSLCSFLGLRGGGALEQTGAWVFGLAMPLLLAAYAVAALNLLNSTTTAAVAGSGAAPLWARGIFGLVALTTLAGGAVGAWQFKRYRHKQEERRVAREQLNRDELAREEAEAVARRDAGLAQIARTPVDGPLGPWLDLLNHSETEVRDAARKIVDARPTLHADLAAMLATEDRTRALSHIRWRLNPPPAELAAPMLECATTLPEWIQRKLAVLSSEALTEVDAAVESVVIVSERFTESGSSVDFRPAIERLNALVEKDYAALHFRTPGLLKFWLERNGSAKQTAAAKPAAP